MRIARLLILALLTADAALGQSPDIILTRLFGNARFIEARDFIATNHDQIFQSESATKEEGEPASRCKALMEVLELKHVAIDEHGNVSGVREGQQAGPFVAVVTSLDDPQAITSMAAVARAMNAAHVTTKTGVVFICFKSADDVGALLESGPYRDQLRSFVAIQSASENIVTGPANAIGSTVVQYGLQSVSAYGGDPTYKPATGILETPIRLRIPSVGLGVGESSPTTRGIQTVLATVLAVAGL